MGGLGFLMGLGQDPLGIKEEKEVRRTLYGPMGTKVKGNGLG